ncbi:S24 family peptidase [Aminobacter ciceronei]|uniref:Uncharacterized protein n=1 Tax=Aminobacter ciceronei TaxID=150723 RepID=A0ABR6C745_9HYPH|nr:S24 family peptidase [Aminobacter ciceronei]MBA8906777.1 hypothetical protein [Aminobacter ciceronei]MBA9020556.1 hypothetical protein [Aminobacter ciceronei]
MTLHTNGGHDAPDFMPKLQVDGGFVFVTCKEGHRLSISATIECLIDMLDTMEPDPDLEDNSDDEPWLGWPNAAQPACGDMSQDSDREADWADAEPTLGATENHPRPLGHGRSKDGAQNGWSTGIAVVADGENEPCLAAAESHPSSREFIACGVQQPRSGAVYHDRSHNQEQWAKGDASGDDREDDDEREPDQDDEYSLGWGDGSQAVLQARDEYEASLGFVGIGTGWRAGEDDNDTEACQLGDNELEADPAESGVGDEDGLYWMSSETLSERGARSDVRNPAVLPEFFPDRFSMVGAGSCCEPLIADGSRLFVDRQQSLKPGGFVVVFRDPAKVSSGDHVMKVKRLVSQTEDAYVVEMLNPPTRITYQRKDVLAVWHCEVAPADYVPGPVVTDGEMLAKRAAEMRRQAQKLTYAERAHRMPDGTIMRTFVASNDVKVIH